MSNYLDAGYDAKEEAESLEQLKAQLKAMRNRQVEDEQIKHQLSNKCSNLINENNRLRSAANILADQLGRYTGRPVPTELEAAMEGRKFVESRFVD